MKSAQPGWGAPLHSGLLMVLSYYWSGSHKGPTLAAKPNRNPPQDAELTSISLFSLPVNRSHLPRLSSGLQLLPLGLGWAGHLTLKAFAFLCGYVCVCV